jgi:glycosyltransferase involved in cell wall biosynthesis
MKRKRRLLIYCDEYPPAPKGGIGSVTQIVAEGLVRRGWQVAVAGSYEYGTMLPAVSQLNGVDVFRFSYFDFLRFVPRPLRRVCKAMLRKTGLLSLLAARALECNERKIDELLGCLQIDAMELIDYIALLQEVKHSVTLRRFSVPSTLRVHGSVSFLNFHRGASHTAQLENDRRNFARADYISAVSEFAQQFVNEHLLEEPRPIEVLYNPIEDELLRGSKPNKTSNTILFYGKVTPAKGAFQVLKAFQAMADAFPDWSLVLMGGGDIAAAQCLVESRCRDRIRFTGYVDRAHVIQAIDEAAFVVAPSYFENFSMVPLEVMARQTAIIYTSRASGKEIIADGVNGLLIDPDDLRGLEAAMARLIRDEPLRNELATAGLRTVRENFALSVILDQLEEQYTSLIDCPQQNVVADTDPRATALLSHGLT